MDLREREKDRGRELVGVGVLRGQRKKHRFVVALTCAFIGSALPREHTYNLAVWG